MLAVEVTAYLQQSPYRSLRHKNAAGKVNHDSLAPRKLGDFFFSLLKKMCNLKFASSQITDGTKDR